MNKLLSTLLITALLLPSFAFAFGEKHYLRSTSAACEEGELCRVSAEADTHSKKLAPGSPVLGRAAYDTWQTKKQKHLFVGTQLIATIETIGSTKKMGISPIDL